MEKDIVNSVHNDTPSIKIGSCYIKCHLIEKKCKWRFSSKHNNFSYLDDTCYLSGYSKLDCPD